MMKSQKVFFNAMLHDASHTTAETVENPLFDGQIAETIVLKYKKIVSVSGRILEQGFVSSTFFGLNFLLFTKLSIMTQKSYLCVCLTLLIFISTLNAQSSVPDSVEILMNEGKYLESVSLLQSYIQSDEEYYTYYYNLGKIYQSLSLHFDACKSFLTLLKYEPDNISCHLSLGNSCMKLERFSMAKEHFSFVLERDSSNIAAKLNLARIYESEKDYISAMDIYRELLQISSMEDMALFKLGQCAFDMGKFKMAQNYLEETCKNNPENLQAHILLGRIYYIAKDYGRAKQLIGFELKKYPERFDLILFYGAILFNKKDYKEAILYYTKIIDNGKGTFEEYQKLGLCYYYIDKPEYADLMLMKSFVKDSTNGLTAYFIGLSNLDLFRYDKAEEFLSKAIIKSTPSYFSEIYIRLAMTKESQNKYEESFKYYKAALLLDPNRTEIKYYIAIIHDKYYNDDNLTIQYYEDFISGSERSDLKMVEYAEYRIQKIKESQFMTKNEEE